MKKLGKWKQILICLLMLPLMAIFPSGCGKDDTSNKGTGQVINNTYTVHFFTDSKETFNIETQVIAHGGLVRRPTETPKKNGYVFIGWFKDLQCTEVWTFEIDVVISDMTLYAGWQKRSS